jgi:hypothetical protein
MHISEGRSIFLTQLSETQFDELSRTCAGRTRTGRTCAGRAQEKPGVSSYARLSLSRIGIHCAFTQVAAYRYAFTQVAAYRHAFTQVAAYRHAFTQVAA